MRAAVVEAMTEVEEEERYALGSVCRVLAGMPMPIGATVLLGFYRGISPGITGSIVTESTKTRLEHTNPNLRCHFSHLFAGGIGASVPVAGKEQLLVAHAEKAAAMAAALDRARGRLAAEEQIERRSQTDISSEMFSRFRNIRIL